MLSLQIVPKREREKRNGGKSKTPQITKIQSMNHMGKNVIRCSNNGCWIISTMKKDQGGDILQCSCFCSKHDAFSMGSICAIIIAPATLFIP